MNIESVDIPWYIDFFLIVLRKLNKIKLISLGFQNIGFWVFREKKIPCLQFDLAGLTPAQIVFTGLFDYL